MPSKSFLVAPLDNSAANNPDTGNILEKSCETDNNHVAKVMKYHPSIPEVGQTPLL